MKLHIGCGTIYLKGWINLDLYASNCFLAPLRPDLVEQYLADESDYYGRHKQQTIERFRAGPKEQEIVCDLYGDFKHIPLMNESVDEILSRQTFEHMDMECARLALNECRRVLNDGGILRLDVPD